MIGERWARCRALRGGCRHAVVLRRRHAERGLEPGRRQLHRHVQRDRRLQLIDRFPRLQRHRRSGAVSFWQSPIDPCPSRSREADTLPRDGKMEIRARSRQASELGRRRVCSSFSRCCRSAGHAANDQRRHQPLVRQLHRRQRRHRRRSAQRGRALAGPAACCWVDQGAGAGGAVHRRRAPPTRPTRSRLPDNNAVDAERRKWPRDDAQFVRQQPGAPRVRSREEEADRRSASARP